MASFTANQTYPCCLWHGAIDETYQVFIKIFLGQLGHQGSCRGGRLGAFESDCVASGDSSRL